MDPLSAISFAAAIVQFVEFSRKIVCKSREIYRSANGLSDENGRTETVTMRLKELTRSMQHSPDATIPGSRRVGSRLQAICQECISVSDTLLGRLNHLKAPNQPKVRQWKSFRNALKSVWTKHEIDAVARRLNDLRGELDTEMIVLLRDNLDAMSLTTSTHLQSLDDKTKEVLHELRGTRLSDSEFLRRFEQLNSSQQSQFEKLGLLSIQQNERFNRLDSNTRRMVELLVETRANRNEEITLSRELLEKTRQAASQLLERDSLERARRARRVRLSILDALRFADIYHRPEMIVSPHETSFRWIFRDPVAHQKPWANFTKWLSEESGIYWIQGKPASGKSTLMRFIHEHSHTRSLLRTWAGSSGVLTGAFYFWISGTENQRSHLGLLRTLLYCLLSQKEDLVLEIFHEEWVRKCDLEMHDLEFQAEEWSLGRLQRAFQSLIGMSSPSLKICLFLDGLDEYEGPSGDMADYLYDLADKFPFTKFCISARPLPDFLSVFRNAPGLKLQDLTQEDIRCYVLDKLGRNRDIQRFFHHDTFNANWLIMEIIRRAQGVFLWVILVVGSLIHGFRSGDGVSQLLKRLENLPVDLENLFSHIIDRIEPEFREEASKIFQIFRASGNNLDLITLHHALHYSSHHDVIAMEARLAKDSKDDIIDGQLCRAIENMRLRLGSRCRGLLEILNQSDDHRPRNNSQSLEHMTQVLRCRPGNGGLEAGSSNFESNDVTSGTRGRQNGIGIHAEHVDKTSLPLTPEGNLLPNLEAGSSTPMPKKQIFSHIPWWEERADVTLAESDPSPCHRPAVWDQTSLPAEPQNLLGSTRSEACWTFVTDHIRAKNYLHTGRLETGLNRQFIEAQAPQNLVLRYDAIYFSAMWLSAAWGGYISDWIHLILTEGQYSREQILLDRNIENRVGERAPPPREGSNEALTKISPEPHRAHHQIVYLHRTAKDFLEQPKNWSQITQHTVNTNFDPQIAILMARVTAVKLTPDEYGYTSGVAFLNKIRDLNLQLSQRPEALELIEEADNVFNMRMKQRGAIGHWSREDPKWTAERPDWGDDLDSIAVKLGMVWLVQARKRFASPMYCASQSELPLPYIPTTTRPGMPLLAYALSMDQWAVGNLFPDNTVLKGLLAHGADPNERFHSHTVWEYAIFWVHILNTRSQDSSELAKWAESFKLMLIHGADPYACCLENTKEFVEVIAGKGGPHQWLMELMQQHDQLHRTFQPVERRGFDDSMWDEDDFHPYHHSATAVVADVFGLSRIPGFEDLKEILKTQMQSRKWLKRKRMGRSGGKDDPWRPNWIT